MKILIISDAWKPQINGVVRTIEGLSKELVVMGHEVHVIGPDPDRATTFSLRSYPEIKLEFFAHFRIARVLHNFAPDYVHIATEGPIGWAARGLCARRKIPFTTSYHTRFPEYLALRVFSFLAPAVKSAAYLVLRWFHAPSIAVLVSTSSIENDLRTRGFKNFVRWSRGVDPKLFNPLGKQAPEYFSKLPRPILLCVSRVAVEKNLVPFLRLKTTGSKVVIGDGPDISFLKDEFPTVHFFGAKTGDELAACYAGADLFVFPSKTDTFGLVLLEACASGLRIAAYPVSGPKDIFESEKSKYFAVMDPKLQAAVDKALALPIDPERPRAYASGFSWSACADQFLKPFETMRIKKRSAPPSPKTKPAGKKPADFIKKIIKLIGF